MSGGSVAECAPNRDASALVGGRKTDCRAVFLPVAAGLPRLANAALRACKSKIAARNLPKPTPMTRDGYFLKSRHRRDEENNHLAGVIGILDWLFLTERQKIAAWTPQKAGAKEKSANVYSTFAGQSECGKSGSGLYAWRPERHPQGKALWSIRY